MRTNVLGTQVLLELARTQGCRFLQVSTDEVYGSLGLTGKFTEDTPLSPNSPYAATKAAADLLVLAAFHSYGQDIVITRSSNNYGPYQYPEKLIPLMITNSLESQPLPVYGQGTNVRDWIHVEDHNSAVWRILTDGTLGRTYLIGAEGERDNLTVMRTILRLMGRSEDDFDHVTDRAGHDLRYAIDPSALYQELGWRPGHTDFEQGLRATIDWYEANESWWGPLKSAVEATYAGRGQ